MKYTPENIEKLARDVVDGMGMSDLFCAMVARLETDYQEDEELFHDDAEIFDDEEASNG